MTKLQHYSSDIAPDELSPQIRKQLSFLQRPGILDLVDLVDHDSPRSPETQLMQWRLFTEAIETGSSDLRNRFANMLHTAKECVKKLEIDIESSQIMCADERALLKQRDTVEKALGLEQSPSCANEITKTDSPEVVIVFEHHHNVHAATARRLLYNEAIKHNLVLATEYLTKDPSVVEVARLLHLNRIGGIPERNGFPAFTAPDLQGLDHELVRGIWTMAILKDNVWSLRTDEGNKMIGEFQTRPAQQGFLEDLIHNPLLQEALKDIWSGNGDDRIASQLSDKSMQDFWRSESQSDYQARVQKLAAGLSLMAGMTAHTPNGWRWNYDILLSEMRGQAHLAQGRDKDDLTFLLLLHTLTDIMKNKFPYSKSEDAIGLLTRDWVFAANAAKTVCDAVASKKKTVVLNVGAAHAERTARYLKAKFGYDALKVRYLNADTPGFRVERIYDKADPGDQPADHFNPSSTCRSSAPNLDTWTQRTGSATARQ